MRLKGKRALVTAGGSGMGAAGVELFCREGAKVAALDRDADAQQRLVDRINAAGGDARAFPVDLLDRGATRTAVQAALEWLGGIEVLWNHAGIPAPTDYETFDFADFERSAELNLNAAVLVSAEVLPRMIAAGGGSIIFTSSTSGLVGSAQSPLYSALKSGVIGLTKGLAVRYGAQNIRINALCPGPVSTPMLHNDFLAADARFSKEEGLARIIANVPMGRMAEPIEIAQAALWLASDEAAFVTGIALPIDGGWTAR